VVCDVMCVYVMCDKMFDAWFAMRCSVFWGVWCEM